VVSAAIGLLGLLHSHAYHRSGCIPQSFFAASQTNSWVLTPVFRGEDLWRDNPLSLLEI
jgi:hypothetical protein